MVPIITWDWRHSDLLVNNKIDKIREYYSIKKSSNLHSSVNFRPSASIFMPACHGEQGASSGTMLVCVGAIVGASEEKYHILSKYNNILFVRITVSGRRWIIQYALRIVIPSLLLYFCPCFQQILGQTHDEMENGKLAAHIYESFRPSSPIDPYPMTW